MNFVWENFVFAIVAFLILYLLLRKYAFGALFDVMEKRRALVQQQMDEAANSRTQAQTFVEEQKQALATARKEAYDIIEQARQTSARQADDIIAGAKEESVRLKEEAARDIESEKNKAVAALRNEVSSMSVAIASKILEKQVDEKEQEQLVGQYLKEVGDKQ
ncbi:F0F1 ATP synthase subunit B [Paenibacillus apiarius]|uniref:ATP synthase subunit b n=1 Tax=Paenibacillus apiarius TaxID=46240 RepID=A0ABT4DWL6_9BACL|nr:F0F1 ATP synthase subunit B [Paenibacillus apiarius]MBN3523930.1 F0F1 ATP synthase subunit B [Paenibacillus apiarius]MCY9514243.1 F0F1 ATP synthase subunit B [Paenibacillus apiarius]MCY9520366.1 F0F1 ATP synthase subunit B [Paenibacillus apiarius]MCY9554737.1 F0F1 ATP synthase subunit B [Paenibacillus apiarius]MCY9557354.1 F0F1 ATP synthase subunit B [Paenibacillus apiarius]